MELAPSVIEKYKEQANRCSFEFLFNALNLTSLCESTYKASGNQRLHVEFTLVKLSRLSGEQEKKSSINIEPEQTDKQEIREEKRPKETKPQGTRSIKEMMQLAKEKTEKSEGSKPREIGEDTFGQQELELAWKDMADSEKNLQRLANAILGTKPVISENPNTIIFYVSNDLQKEWINSKCKLRLETFLKERLNNKYAELLVEVSAIDENREEKPYMPEEKAKFLMEKHPELKELQKDLKLEIK